ncbi:DUF6273 domain-containing protein, partial [Eubacterium xylanophilum]|uniref:DUF6273 domain-containing protein n=1 Tax=Eubacterium xylanophilum TaxID=39497 RepID=UPI000553E530
MYKRIMMTFMFCCALFIMSHIDASASMQQGDKEITHIYFGNYYQSDSSRKEPIEWRLCWTKENVAYLESAKSLEFMVYDDTWSGKSTWATSFCRQWLNSRFLNDAFNEYERSLLKQVLQDNYRKQDLSTVYLSRFFEGIPVEATKYALRKYPEIGPCVWWITNLWMKNETQKYAYSTAENDMGGPGVDVGYRSRYEGNTLVVSNYIFGIRPSIYMDISKGGWKISRYTKKNSKTGKYENYYIDYADSQDEIGVETLDVEYANRINKSMQTKVSSELLQYKIKKPSIKSSKKSKNKAVIQWKKTDDSTSYDLWYSTTKKFTKKKT